MGVRVPRITIKADFGDEASFGELSTISIGYGLHQAWIYATMFGAATVFDINPILQGEGVSGFSLPFITSILVYGFALLFISFTDQRLLRFYVSRKVATGAAVVMTAGTLLLALPPLGIGPDLAIQAVSGVLTGIGSALLIVFWGTAFAREENSTIVLNTALAFAFAMSVYAIILHHIPAPFASVATAIIPLLELPILLAKTPRPFLERDDYPIFQPLPIKRGSFVLKFGLPIAVFGLALGALRQTSLQDIVTAATTTDQLIVVMAACVALVLILVTLMALNSANRWNQLFRPLVPFIAIVVIFFTSTSTGEWTIASAFLLVGYLCFEALVWICFGELSQNYRLSPVFVFGLGRGTLALAGLAGSLHTFSIENSSGELPFGEGTFAVVALLVMVIAYALLPREREIEKLVVPCPLTMAMADGSLERSVPLTTPAQTSESAGQPAMSANAPVAPGSPAPAVSEAAGEYAAASAPSASAEVSLPIDATPVAMATATAIATPAPAATIAPAASSASPAPAQGTPRPSSTPEAAMPANQTPAPTLAEAPAAPAASGKPAPVEAAPRTASTKPAPTTPGELWPAEKRGRFKRKCEAVANRYLLSTRETEVLFFLAKGHNATSIQEQLYISEGTAKTHIRHIYRKLDIHSQQELIQMVDNAEVD